MPCRERARAENNCRSLEKGELAGPWTEKCHWSEHVNGEALVGRVKQGAEADLTGPGPAVVKSGHVFS